MCRPVKKTRISPMLKSGALGAVSAVHEDDGEDAEQESGYLYDLRNLIKEKNRQDRQESGCPVC